LKPIQRGEVLGLADYETIRERFRDRIIAEKKLRRVQVGPNVNALFENRDTVLLQIQEMLRTERITRPAAVDHEILTYGESLPGDDQLSCTVMIEIPDTIERDAFLRAAVGFEKHVWLVAGGERMRAIPIAHGGELEDRTTAVHYLKFDLPKALAASLRASAPGDRPQPRLEIEVDHPAYAARVALSDATVAELCEDLRS
jgi:hypothetical protein